jgi:AMP-binding enzyme C-terminal domain
VLNVDRPKAAVAAALVEELRSWVANQLSPIAKPDDIRFADNLPKTRSGKIMRRLLRSIARGEEITQDVSTLENPGILEQLRGVPQAAAKPSAPQRAAAPKKAPRNSGAAKRPAHAKRSVGRKKQPGPQKRAPAVSKARAKKAAPIKKSAKRGKAARKPRSKK